MRQILTREVGQPMKTNEEVWSIVNELKALYPDSLCSLEYEKDYEPPWNMRRTMSCCSPCVWRPSAPTSG